MSELAQRWRAEMSRPHVIIRDIREIGTSLANENEQMRAALMEIRDKAATMPNGGAWAGGMAQLCLGTLPR